jgi:hypothetical protein
VVLKTSLEVSHASFSLKKIQKPMVSSRFALEIAFFSFQYQNSHQVTMQGDLVWLSAVVQIITVMSSARGRGGMPARAEGDCHGRVCLTG